MDSYYWIGALGPLHLFFLGLLAGEELVIRFGVREPVASLRPAPHIELRQALIRRMRILVPVLFACAFVTSSAMVWMTWAHQGFRLATALSGLGLALLVAFMTVTLTGTVPINKAALDWQPEAPPRHWLDDVRRWERLDSARTFIAMAAFALFLLAVPF